jgi:hypothetical protein
MAEPNPSPPRHSLWERLGQGMAQGWEKAKEVSSRLGELATLKLDLKSARDHLESRYRLLGTMAADRLIDREEGQVDASEAGVRAALEDIRSARAAVAAIEKKLSDLNEKPGEGSPPTPAGDAPPR